MDPRNDSNDQRKTLIPSDEATPLQEQDLPTTQTGDIPVPQDQIDAGHDTDAPEADSPESLDQDIAEGADRSSISPTDQSRPL